MTEITEFLLNRRSTKLMHLAEPGPDDAQIEQILKIASRVPDHGKYAPWYFVVLKNDNRLKAGALLREAFKHDNAEAIEAKLEIEEQRFMRAPVVVAVVSRMKRGKHPQWEQILSAGAACYNLCLGANSLGFGSNWLSEWYSFSDKFKANFGLDHGDHFAGFIYIGTQTERNEERERPDLEKITTFWDGNAPLRKGDEYGNSEKTLPKHGFCLK